MQELILFLEEYDRALMDLTTLAIERAAEKGDTAFLTKIHSILLNHVKPLRRLHETRDSASEEEELEHFFDDV